MAMEWCKRGRIYCKYSVELLMSEVKVGGISGSSEACIAIWCQEVGCFLGVKTHLLGFLLGLVEEIPQVAKYDDEHVLEVQQANANERQVWLLVHVILIVNLVESSSWNREG